MGGGRYVFKEGVIYILLLCLREEGQELISFIFTAHGTEVRSVCEEEHEQEVAILNRTNTEWDVLRLRRISGVIAIRAEVIIQLLCVEPALRWDRKEINCVQVRLVLHLHAPHQLGDGNDVDGI